MKHFLVAMAASSLLFSGCSSTPTPNLEATVQAAVEAAVEATRAAEPTATPTPAPTYSPLPTFTPAPTYTPYPTYTSYPTATPVPPTNTPVPTETNTPVPKATATSEAETRPFIGPITFATGATEDGNPVGASDTFTGEITEIHALFTYKGMADGTPWERGWHLDGKRVGSGSGVWDQGSTGVYHLSMNNGGRPLDAGNWELEIYVDGEMLRSGQLVIKSGAEPTETNTAVPPTPTPAPDASPEPQPAQSGEVPLDANAFTQYLAQKYSSINGQPLTFDQVSIFTKEEYSSNFVNLSLTDEAGRVFADQTQKAATEYGWALLNDTKAFFQGEECSAYVREKWYTDSLPDYAIGNDWYYIGDYDVDFGWYVSKSYVRAHFLDGRDSVRVWNYK